MIRIAAVEVSGMSAAGPFRGTLEFAPGLQVISARNSWGKSLAAKSIAWCLGLEPFFGSADNDPSLFPLAAREEVEFDGQLPVTVTSSECTVTLVHSDGRQLQLGRDIKGDPAVVRACEYAADGTERRCKLHPRKETMQDERGGLQRFLFEWLGWPRANVATYKGVPAEIYLENLAPLFYIEQDEGWTDLQARQIRRYGQQQIVQVAVEYLLGATQAVKARLAQQMAIQQVAGLRASGRLIADRVRLLFSRRGWSLDWSGSGSLEDVAARWSSCPIQDALRAGAQVDLVADRGRLEQRAESLRQTLTRDPVDPADISAHSAASQSLISLKRHRHELNEELGALRGQHDQTEALIASLEQRIHSASDVLRLKTTGVGRLTEVECPTCHRDLDPATFALTEQSQESVNAHIEALKRDRDLMRKNLDSCIRRMSAVEDEARRVELDFREAERALTTVTAAVGTVREQLAQTAATLAATEREIDRVAETAAELAELQGVVDQWVDDARTVSSLLQGEGDLKERLAIFAEQLRQYLLALGHSAVNAHNAGEVDVDDQYNPNLGTRSLKSLGSASDRPRLVAAYCLAIAAAAERVAGPHPGLVILDEPLQQNPDDPHRELFSSFLSGQLALDVTFQSVVFTFLRGDEIELARKNGVNVVTPEGVHFLKLEPAEPVPEVAPVAEALSEMPAPPDAAEGS